MGTLLALGACAAAPGKVPEDVPVWRKDVQLAEASQVGWKRQNKAFGKDFRWRVGDRVLYALTRHNQGDVEQRFIEIRVESLAEDLGEGEHWNHIFFLTDSQGKPQTLHSMNMQVRVTISDETGKTISSTESEIPEAYLRMGFFRGCEASARIRRLRKSKANAEGSMRMGAPTEFYEAVASLQALFSVVASSKSLRPILEEVVEKPPLVVLLPALFSGGISISIAPDFMAARRVTIPEEVIPDRVLQRTSGIEAYSFPMTISINEYPGLYVRFLVAPPEELAPLGGGVISVEGRHPRNKDIWLTMRLLGSHRDEIPGLDPALPTGN